jgi:hypothetical protein
LINNLKNKWPGPFIRENSVAVIHRVIFLFAASDLGKFVVEPADLSTQSAGEHQSRGNILFKL